MLSARQQRLTMTILALAGIISFLGYVTRAEAAPQLEFCEHSSSDQQLRASRNTSSSSATGCVPLVEKKEPSTLDGRINQESARQMKVDNLQSEAVTFLQRYNQFLECCRTDLTELQSVEELGNEVNELLIMAQTGLFSEHMKLRGWTIAELLPPVAKARADLKRLHARLETIGNARSQLDQLDYESSAKESRRIHELEDSIQKDFQTRSLPGGPKTGAGIGASSTVGTNIGRTPRAGTDIGAGGSQASDVGATPRSGASIGASGPTGFDIGATGRAGANIGESRLNSDQSAVGSSLQQSTVGSNIGDTSVGSSLGQSTIGSSLSDTSIGSSLGGSSIGSSLQNRSTNR
ncbi:MAG: hypothetical protein LZF86_110720 [Nitrospira sp.]|nr:MAG: hypothetical protein LZF86_110720 [Nitrospira sp.]